MYGWMGGWRMWVEVGLASWLAGRWEDVVVV